MKPIEKLTRIMMRTDEVDHGQEEKDNDGSGKLTMVSKRLESV
jgi:hypothetical protein